MKVFIGVISRILLLAFFSLSLPSQASMMSAADTMPSIQQTSERAKVMQFLAREDVVKTIAQQGVDVAVVRQRVAAMNDDEINQLSGQIDQLPAAGSDILGVAVFIFVLLLITDIRGLTKIFPFTPSVR